MNEAWVRLLSLHGGDSAIMSVKGKGLVKSCCPETLKESSVHRPQDTEMVVDAHLAQWAVRTTSRLMGLGSIVIGLAILLGGQARFMGISYEAALAAPGAPWSWGTTSLLAGLLIEAGSIGKAPRLIAAGSWLGAFWSSLFACSFFLVFLREPTANATAMWAYLFISIFYGMMGGVHYVMHPMASTARLVEKLKGSL